MDQEAGLPQIFTPWSDNETKLMYRLFPNPDSLCLNFGRTGVFQWNYPNSSILTQTTEWPQKVAGHIPRRCDMGGLTHTRIDPQPHMPYAIFRNMGPHFDSYANSGIPAIRGTKFELHRWEDRRRCQLLHLLQHLHLIDVGTCMEHRIGDLQTLTHYAKHGEKFSFPPQPLHHPQTDQPERGLTSNRETTIWPHSRTRHPHPM